MRDNYPGMKWKLSIWSGALLLLLGLLVLNLLRVIRVDAWGIFGFAVTIVCLWAIYRIFFSKR